MIEKHTYSGRSPPTISSLSMFLMNSPDRTVREHNVKSQGQVSMLLYFYTPLTAYTDRVRQALASSLAQIGGCRSVFPKQRENSLCSDSSTGKFSALIQHRAATQQTRTSSAAFVVADLSTLTRFKFLYQRRRGKQEMIHNVLQECQHSTTYGVTFTPELITRNY